MRKPVMRNNTKQSLYRFFVFISVAIVATSCAITEPEKQYYQVLHEQALHSEMREMAMSLGVLADYYFEDARTDEELYRSVHAELDKIEKIASGLGGSDTVTNYSVINRYMGAFLYDVNLAREFAEREPPNFVPAFRLLKSCQACHESM